MATLELLLGVSQRAIRVDHQSQVSPGGPHIGHWCRGCQISKQGNGFRLLGFGHESDCPVDAAEVVIGEDAFAEATHRPGKEVA
jgi:hypothetical protein